MSSRNIKKGKTKITGSMSLNPVIMPYNHSDIDTILGTSTRSYGNSPNSSNPILSGHFNYGVNNYYESGFGFDLSILGLSIIFDNKIGLTDIMNSDKQKKIGLSYYNKTSFTRGVSLFGATFLPFKPGHFEFGNYLLVGFFINDFELILSPHVDYNILLSDKYEDYYVEGDYIVSNYTNNIPTELRRTSRIVNNEITFLNYGLNLMLRTKTDFFFEVGVQYMSTNVKFYMPVRNNENIQFYFGIAKSFEF